MLRVAVYRTIYRNIENAVTNNRGSKMQSFLITDISLESGTEYFFGALGYSGTKSAFRHGN
jgi:hypothetical protein